MVALLVFTCFDLPARASSEPRSDIRVVTTIAPLYALTAGVMEGVAEPELLLKQGDSPHHFSLRPNDAENIMKADIVIATSRTHAYFLVPVLKLLPKNKGVFVEALTIPALTLLPTTGALEDTQHESTVDMHFWLNPVNAIAYTYYIAEVLGNADKAHTATYRNNAARQVMRIRELDAAIKTLLETTPRHAQYASYHPSLAYFEKYYGIKGGKAITRTPETGTTTEEAEALYRDIEAGKIRCLFEEPEFSSRLVQQAAQRFPGKVRVITLDSLGSTYALDGDFYDALLMDVATQVKACSSGKEPKK